MNNKNQSINTILKILKEYNIKFNRGNPEKYFKLIEATNSGLTIQSTYSNNNYQKLIHLKNLFVLWNIYIDDSIDINNEDKVIFESHNYLISSTSLKNKSITQFILQSINKHFSGTILENINKFDYLNIVNAFLFEYLVQNSFQPSYYEYKKYSTITASLIPLLNIDYLFSDDPQIVSHYKELRNIYDLLSQAIKLSSDIGSLKREDEVEKSSNSILLLFQENNSEGSARNFDKEISINKLQSKALFNEAKQISNSLKINLANIFETVENIIHTYNNKVDMFFNQNV